MQKGIGQARALKRADNHLARQSMLEQPVDQGGHHGKTAAISRVRSHRLRRQARELDARVFANDAYLFFRDAFAEWRLVRACSDSFSDNL
jgi:hypothetical protein